MPHWWRYWSFGIGMLALLAAGTSYLLLDPSTVLAYFDIFLLVAAALLIFFSGLETQFAVGTRRIRTHHFVAASQLLFGVLLLSSPAVAFLDQTIESYDVINLVTGLFMLLLGLGTMYRPATFGPYDSAD
jgi:hypothetical protein